MAGGAVCTLLFSHMRLWSVLCCLPRPRHAGGELYFLHAASGNFAPNPVTHTDVERFCVNSVGAAQELCLAVRGDLILYSWSPATQSLHVTKVECVCLSCSSVGVVVCRCHSSNVVSCAAFIAPPCAPSSAPYAGAATGCPTQGPCLLRPFHCHWVLPGVHRGCCRYDPCMCGMHGMG
jgi:hypothetical protein